MFRSSRDVGSPRRVVAFHLLFGAVTVALLSAGIVNVAVTIFTEHADTPVINMLDKVGPLLSADLRRAQGENLGDLLRKAVEGYSLDAIAIIGPDQKYLAHSHPGKVGEPAETFIGQTSKWGDVDLTIGSDQEGRQIRVYQTSLRDQGESIGTLQAISTHAPAWHSISVASRHGMLFILLGIASCLAGSLWLYRDLRPLESVERQLRSLATADFRTVEIERVNATSLAAVGWNRMIDETWKRASGNDLETRLAEGLRGRREKRSDAILNAISDGIVMTDSDQKIIFANPAFSSLMSTSSEQTLGQEMDSFLHYKDSPNGMHKFADSLYTAQQVVGEYHRGQSTADGVLRVSRIPLARSSPDESPAGHVWTVRDVTQQKLAEEMRSQFVSSATHELRTPLSNIKAYAETLASARDLDVEKQKDFCNTINMEASRLSRFIDDLLDISHMEAGSMTLHRHETDLIRLFDEAISKVRPEMTAKNISFESMVPAKLPKASLDKDKITVTLINLLGNAVKYTPEGGRVGFEVDASGGHITVHVSDSGIGIAPEEQGKIFEKFFRSSDPRVRDRKGSGLGLAIAQEVARAHGGNISLHSEINKGSKFTLSIPLA